MGMRMGIAMQHRDMDMQHGNMGIEHGHLHETWTWTLYVHFYVHVMFM
jgi:hypothetical protein